MRRVILESPYAGDVKANVAYARACLLDCLERGEAPITSHLLYTQPGVLDDNNPEERRWGIEAGLAWSDTFVCEAAVFYTDRGWSKGMLAAKEHHVLSGTPVEERTLPGYVAPASDRPEARFTLRAWGDGVPTTAMLGNDLERNAMMVRNGFQSGEAAVDEDFDGQGWWEQAGFEEPSATVTCECGAEVDTDTFGEWGVLHFTAPPARGRVP